MADDIAGLITALDLGPAHVAGMSMGGILTQRLAISHPELVRSATVMMSTTNHPSMPAMDPAAQAVLFSAPDDPEDPESVVALGLKIYATLRGKGFDYDVDSYADRIRDDLKRSPDLLGYGRNLLAGIAAPAYHGQVNQIKAPTLVLHGDEDLLFPVEVAQYTADNIPGARLKIIKGLGHEVFSPDLAPIMIDAIAGHCAGN